MENKMRANEDKLFNALRNELIKYVDSKKIIREFPLGRSFRADCVVLGSDNRTPILCFEFKQKAINGTLSDEYRRILKVYRQYAGVSACYIVNFGIEETEIIISDDNKRYVIGKDRDLDLFLGIYTNEIAVSNVNQVPRNSIKEVEEFKKVTLYTSLVSALTVIVLDILGLFPLTYERLIFIALIMALVILPFFIKVIAVHPKFLDLLELAIMKGIKK